MTDNQPTEPRHSKTRQDFDEAQLAGLYEEGMANMALYHRHCQDPVIFKALGDVRGKTLLDLACGDGFYTRRFRKEAGADPVVGIDLSPMQIEKAKAIEDADPLGIEYFAGDASDLDLGRRFDIVTAIHLLHYLESGEEIAGVLGRVHSLLTDSGRFVTMVANPEFDLDIHDPEDSKKKFAYYFSAAPKENGAVMTFHPGGLEKEREITIGLRRWHRDFVNDIAREAGFEPEWHDPFISEEGLEEYGAGFFENYLPNPQSKLLVLYKQD
ncbi:MAG: class I SAM-dependent methyltransferase [Aridibacter famidurans]|nr:class I SAM-dependent methyltransferase [Aridibacter famidurans]